ADSKPLPDNNSRHKPRKLVIGVGGHPLSGTRETWAAPFAPRQVLHDAASPAPNRKRPSVEEPPPRAQPMKSTKPSPARIRPLSRPSCDSHDLAPDESIADFSRAASKPTPTSTAAIPAPKAITSKTPTASRPRAAESTIRPTAS